MILERVGAPVFGVMMAAAAVTPKPVEWHLLGYPFEAASMIAALFAALTTRVIVGMRGKTVPRPLDFAVLALVLLTTAVVVASTRANLLSGLLYGTGLAATGEGLIRLAEKWIANAFKVLGIPPASPDDVEAIGQALRKTYEIPDEKDVS